MNEKAYGLCVPNATSPCDGIGSFVVDLEIEPRVGFLALFGDALATQLEMEHTAVPL